MTQWVMYLSLFDFEINHVPAEKHQAPDGLSHQKRTLDDSEEEDAEEDLAKLVGCMTFSETECSPLLSLSAHFSLPPIPSTTFTTNLLCSLMSSPCCIPDAPFGSYESPTSMLTVCCLGLDEDDDEHNKPSQMECWSFWKHSQNFILHDNCLWKTEKKGKSPRLVITDLDHQKLLISQVHNEVGHRGHDSTYRLLSECYYWPDLYDSIAYFVSILQRFDLDTVHIEDGYGSKHFLGKCETGSIYWSVMFNVCGQEVCSGMVYTSSPLNRVPATLCREVWQARVFS
ncbi:hypothetical protein L208DRAFT_1282285 [Tricholoma matsutake]|nr:hypothetical protein L208DRAFT_1282285 [Tricholoma matsutake 945]